jgi:hypothetical protein
MAPEDSARIMLQLGVMAQRGGARIRPTELGPMAQKDGAPIVPAQLDTMVPVLIGGTSGASPGGTAPGGPSAPGPP